jgi:hypothetical protein
MGWERRGNGGGLYYYTAERIGGKVIKRYLHGSIPRPLCDLNNIPCEGTPATTGIGAEAAQREICSTTRRPQPLS